MAVVNGIFLGCYINMFVRLSQYWAWSHILLSRVFCFLYLYCLAGIGREFNIRHNWQVGMGVVVTSMVPACKRSGSVVLLKGATKSNFTKRGYCRVGSVAGF